MEALSPHRLHSSSGAVVLDLLSFLAPSPGWWHILSKCLGQIKILLSLLSTNYNFLWFTYKVMDILCKFHLNYTLLMSNFDSQHLILEDFTTFWRFSNSSSPDKMTSKSRYRNAFRGLRNTVLETREPRLFLTDDVHFNWVLHVFLQIF